MSCQAVEEGPPFPAQQELSPPKQQRQRGQEITSALSDRLLPEGCPGCLPQKRLVASVLLPPPPLARARGMGHPPLCAQGCTSSTHMPTCSPASQGNLGVPHKTHWTQASLMNSALGQLQDHEGLLGQLQEESSALSKHKVCLAKRPAVVSRSARLPPLGRLPWEIQSLAISAADCCLATLCPEVCSEGEVLNMDLLCRHDSHSGRVILLSVYAQDLLSLAHCFPRCCPSYPPTLLPGLPNMTTKIMKSVPVVKSTTCAQFSCSKHLQQVPQLAAPALSQPGLVQQALAPYPPPAALLAPVEVQNPRTNARSARLPMCR